MSRRAPFNVRFRPQPIATAEIERSSDATDRLLAEPTDWLRRLHCARVDVALEAPVARHEVLEREGCRPLCTAWLRHPGPVGRIERRVEVWIDPTTTIRVEVVGEKRPRIYLSTLFEDGHSVVMLRDEIVADWLRSPTCDVLQGSGDLRADFDTFRQRSEMLQRRGHRPLLCANGEAYQRHLRLTVLHQSKAPDASVQRRVIYPMTLMLAAEVVAHRDAVADQITLLASPRSPTARVIRDSGGDLA